MRSPNYPTQDLEQTLQAARKIYGQAQRHPAGRAVILKALGYESDSGASRAVLAALRAFNLLEMQGDGEARNGQLTGTALDILLDERADTSEREARIRDLALAPKIHRETWDKYQGALPDDAVIKYWLVREKGFTETGAKEFLKQFRATIAFTGLQKPAKMTSAPAEAAQLSAPPNTVGGGKSSPAPAGMAEAPKMRTIQIPYQPEAWASLEAAFPLSEDDWEQMVAVLTAMRPALVRRQPAPTSTQQPLQPGDTVQWTSQGTDQFSLPKRIASIQGGHALFDGETTGVPLAQLRKA